MSCAFKTEGQFVYSGFIAGIFIECFFQVSNGLFPCPEVLELQGNVNANLSSGVTIGKNQGAFEAIDGLFVLCDLAVNRPQCHQDFFVVGLNVQEVLEQWNSFDGFPTIGPNLRLPQLQPEMTGIKLARMAQSHFRSSGFFDLEVMLNKPFQFIHVKEGLISIADHGFKLANQVLERRLVLVCLFLSVHNIKAKPRR